MALQWAYFCLVAFSVVMFFGVLGKLVDGVVHYLKNPRTSHHFTATYEVDSKLKGPGLDAEVAGVMSIFRSAEK